MAAGSRWYSSNIIYDIFYIFEIDFELVLFGLATF
jgi:hypothetical protein